MGKNSDDISVTLDNNKVYTSYYARATKIFPNSRLISVSLGVPSGFAGGLLRELNPSPSLLNAYKSGKITDEEYETIYRNETLSKLDRQEIYTKLKGKVILCYCGKDKFCHRHIIIKWLLEELPESIAGGEI